MRSVIVFLAIVSIIYGALAAMYFVVKKDGDVKKLVAYSSVSSMGMVMLGLFALNPNGVNGGVMQMINHGIYSGALFLLVGIIYERRHTRNVAEFGGLSHVMPGYAAIFLGMVMTAIGLPLLAVFISEFLALRGSFEANPYWAAWAALGIILNAGYFLVALPANVFRQHRQSEERTFDGSEHARVGLHGAADDSFAVDRRLSETVSRIHSTACECGCETGADRITRFRERRSRASQRSEQRSDLVLIAAVHRSKINEHKLKPQTLRHNNVSAASQHHFTH